MQEKTWKKSPRVKSRKLFGLSVVASVVLLGAYLTVQEQFDSSDTVQAEVQAAAFTPTDITGLALWLDASDAGTVTVTSGSDVDTWSDKSGNANNVSQSTVASKPQTGGSLNGLNAINFDGADDYLFKTGKPFTGTVGRVFAVFKLTNTQNYQAVLTQSDSANNTEGVYLYGRRTFSNLELSADADIVKGDTTISAATTYLASWEGDNNNFTMRVNGHEEVITVTLNNDTGFWFGTKATDRMVIGNRIVPAGSDIPFNGLMGEILVYDDVNLSRSEVAAVEGYLASKWGVTIPPDVVSVTPAQNTNNISASSDIVVVFNQSMNTGTITQANLPIWGSQTGLINGTYSFSTTTISNDTVTFNPTYDFVLGATIEFIVTSNVQSSGALAAAPFVSNFTVQTSGGTGKFNDSAQSLGSDPTVALELGDVDDDGDIDWIEVGANGPNRLYLNNGSGVFSVSAQSLGNYFSQSMALGDVDNDGDLDFVNGVLFAGNRVWLNNGSGIFTDTSQSLGATGSWGIDLGDVDGDGDLDLLEGNSGAANKIWLNNGSGTFTDSGQSFGANTTRSVALGDVDSDGDLDFVEGNQGQGNEVWLNDGSGTFTNTGQSMGTDSSQSVKLGDLDGDGDLDLVEVIYAAGNKIWLNNGSGIFTDTAQSLGANITLGLDLGDVDGDGDLDLVDANDNQANKVWLNNGSGTFTDSGQSLGTNITQSVNLGDVDGDGDLDLISGNRNQGDRVWINDNAPTITIIQPNGGETLTPGTFTDIVWDVFDDASTISTVDLELSLDNGSTYVTIPGATNAPNTSQYLAKWGSAGSGDGQFSTARGLDVRGGFVYTVDQALSNVQKFDTDGNFILKWSVTGAFNGMDVVIDSLGNVYVNKSNSVRKFDSTGGFLTSWGVPTANGLGIDQSDNIYVAGTSKVRKYNSSGGFLFEFGSGGVGDGQFDNAYDVAVDSAGNIYVIDPNADRLQKFDSSGAFIAKWGANGFGDGQFRSPFDIGVNNRDQIYVPDASRNDIQIFTSTGVFISKFGVTGSADGEVFSPEGVGFDTSDNVYIMDRQNNRVDKFTAGSAFSWLVPGDETAIGLIRGTATDPGTNTTQDTSDAVFSISAPTCATTPAGLVSWWNGDSVSGSTVNDIYGANDGTLTNDATTGTGRVGQGLVFDGTDDSVALDSVIPTNQSLTVMAWVKADNDASYKAIVVNDDSIGGDFDPLFQFRISNTMQLQAFIRDKDTAPIFITGSNTLSTGFHHVAMVFNATTKTATLYSDGLQVATGSAPAMDVNNLSNGIVALGKDTRNGAQGPDVMHYSGTMDEVQVFTRDLSLSEIQSVYGAGTAGVCKGGGGRSTIRIRRALEEELRQQAGQESVLVPDEGGVLEEPKEEVDIEIIEMDLVKVADSDAVYYVDDFGAKHAFLNRDIYSSWYPDFSKVDVIPQADIDALETGTPIFMRPGTWLIKVQSDAKVYAVEQGGVLRWIPSEEAAVALYGDNWNLIIKDLPDAFFTFYSVGDPLSMAPIVYADGTVLSVVNGPNIVFIQGAGYLSLSDDDLAKGRFQTKFFLETDSLVGLNLENKGPFPPFTFDQLIVRG